MNNIYDINNNNIILETLLPNLILIAISFYIVLFIFFSLYMVNYICPNTIREVFTPPLHVRGLKVDTNLTHEKALTLLTRRKRLEGAIKNHSVKHETYSRVFLPIS